MDTAVMPAPFAGRSFEVRYEGLTAINRYDADGRRMRYRITEGPLRGAEGEARYQWAPVTAEVFAISWQEADGSTVVHVDDFGRGTSLSFFTTPDGQFHRLNGQLRALVD